MTVLVASAIVAWVAIIVLTLGFARLLAEVRELQRQSSHAGDSGTTHPELAPDNDFTATVVLALSSTCETCTEVFDAWTDVTPSLTAAGFRPLILALDGVQRWKGRGVAVQSVGDLMQPLLLAYQPALMVVNRDGAIVSAVPVGSKLALAEKCEFLIGSGRASKSMKGLP
jgi:hypothetical protein